MRYNENRYNTTVYRSKITIGAKEAYKKIFSHASVEKIKEIADKKIAEIRAEKPSIILSDKCEDIRQKLYTNIWDKPLDAIFDRENFPFQEENDYCVSQDVEKEEKVNEYYICCPNCHSFSPLHNFVIPLEGWDQILKEYANTLLAQVSISEAYGYYYGSLNDIYVPEQELLVLAENFNTKNKVEDDREADYLRKSDFVFDGISSHFKMTEDGSMKAKCPCCGKEYEILKERLFAFSGYRDEYLTRSQEWYYDNSFYICSGVFNNGDKVSATLMRNHLFPNIYGKMHVITSNIRATFNTKTGQSYLFPTVNMKTKDFAMPELKNTKEKPARIKNITYSYSYADIGDLNAAEEVAAEICKSKGIDPIKISDMEKYGVKFTNYYNYLFPLAVINRYAEYGLDFLATYIWFERYLTAKEKTDIYRMRTDANVFKRFLKKHEVKGKKKIGMIAKNPMICYMDRILKKCGFDNPDVRINMIENHYEWAVTFVSSILDSNDFKDEKWVNKESSPRLNDRKQIHSFVTEYSELKSQAEIMRKAVAANYSFFKDTARMYEFVKRAIELTAQEKMMLLSGTITEIHDRLSEIQSSRNFPHLFIPYTEKEIKLNCKCGSSTFMLAKTTDELKYVGDKMKICVGSYWSKAINKESVIVIMRDAKENLEACIELNPEMTKLKQFKDFCNQTLEPEKRARAVTFLKKNNIDYSMCYDANRSDFFSEECECDFKRLANTAGYTVYASKEDFKEVETVDENKNQDVLNSIKRKMEEATLRRAGGAAMPFW